MKRISKDAALEQLRERREALGLHDGACVMCALLALEPADVILETPLAQVRLDRFACTAGHLMVIAKQHVENVTELGWDAYAHLQRLAFEACRVLESELSPKRVFVAALGSPKAVAQSYPHYHIHVVPVYVDDERARPAHVLSWSSGVTTYSDEQAGQWTARLAHAWSHSASESPVPMSVPSPAHPPSTAQASAPVSCETSVAGPSRLTRGVRCASGVLLGLATTTSCNTFSPTPGHEPPEMVVVTPTNVAPQPQPVAPTAVATVETPTEPTELGAPTIISTTDSTGPHPTLTSAHNEANARPVVTGTLTVTEDGSYAFASDVDRDAVFQITLQSRSVARIDVAPGEQPGQSIEVPPPAEGDSESRVLVALRNGGALLAITPSTGQTTRIPVCTSPRGLAFDEQADRVYVACQTGELLTVNPRNETIERTLALDSDLHDVQVLGGKLLVSRYKSAQVLVVDSEGQVEARVSPDTMPGCSEPSVMFRMVSDGASVYMAHQLATTDTLQVSSGGYGGGGQCLTGSIVPVMTVTDDITKLGTGAQDASLNFAVDLVNLKGGSEVIETGANIARLSTFAVGMAGRAGPLDMAISPSGRIAMTFTGDSLWPAANAIVTFEPSTDQAGDAILSPIASQSTGTLTSVAFDSNDSWLAQAREPSLLLFEDGTALQLDPTSVANTGLDLFYVNTGAGLSCAGCHPDGDEDGRTWSFPQGLRRTQPLGGGVMSRAPFHWDGEMAAMDVLVKDVMLGRMSFETPVDAQQVEILGRWLDSIPAQTSRLVAGDANAAAVERGRVLFSDEQVACASCHSGATYSDNRNYDVGTGGVYYTPTLLGVGLREHLMHDGCATTLNERFGVCGGGDLHGHTSALDADQINDLVAFMRTL